MASTVARPQIVAGRTRKSSSSRVRRLRTRPQSPRSNPRRRRSSADTPARQSSSISTLLILVFGFTAGLVLLAILAVLFLPGDWSALLPGQSTSANDSQFIALVAQKYAQNKNLGQLQRSLAGYDRAELNRILSQIQATSSDNQTRQQMTSVTRVLQLPAVEPTLISTLLGEPIILLGMFLSIVPIGIAFFLITGPRIQQFRKERELEAAIAAGEILPGEESLESDEDLATDEEEEEEEETAEEEEEDDIVIAPSAPLEEVEGEEAEELSPSETQGDAAQVALGDISSLFEEEDVSLSALEAMSKTLPDVNIDELSTNMTSVLQDMRRANMLPLPAK